MSEKYHAYVNGWKAAAAGKRAAPGACQEYLAGFQKGMEALADAMSRARNIALEAENKAKKEI
jgi:hypothetical protein